MSIAATVDQPTKEPKVLIKAFLIAFFNLKGPPTVEDVVTRFTVPDNFDELCKPLPPETAGEAA